MSSEYVIQIDATHANAGNIPTDALAVAGYDTGSPDIMWDTADWQRFPYAGKLHIDQSPALDFFRRNNSDVADVEPGAATVDDFISAAIERKGRGYVSTMYVSYDGLPDAELAVGNSGLGSAYVRYFVANYNWSMAEATQYLNENPDVLAVQFAAPQSNPNTRVPGSVMTLAEAGVDLSVKRADWVPYIGVPAVAWVE